MRISDWSSDVCSSDLNRRRAARGESSRAPARAARPGSIRWEQTRVGREDRPSSHCLEKRLVEAEVGGVGSDVRDRKSVVSGKRVSVRVDLGGSRIIKNKKKEIRKNTHKIKKQN